MEYSVLQQEQPKYIPSAFLSLGTAMLDIWTSGHVGRINVFNYLFKITNSIGRTISMCYMLFHATYQFAALGTFHTDTSSRCSRNGFSQRDCLKHPVLPDAHPPSVTSCCYHTCAPWQQAKYRVTEKSVNFRSKWKASLNLLTQIRKIKAEGYYWFKGTLSHSELREWNSLQAFTLYCHQNKDLFLKKGNWTLFCAWLQKRWNCYGGKTEVNLFSKSIRCSIKENTWQGNQVQKDSVLNASWKYGKFIFKWENKGILPWQ